MQVVAQVRLIDVVIFNLRRMVGGLSVGTLGGTIAMLFVAFVYQAYARHGASSAVIVAKVYLGIVATIGTLLGGLIVAMTVARRDENQPLGEVWYTVSDEGLNLKSGDRHEDLPWNDVTKADRDDRYIWVETSDNQTRFIPRAACASENTFTEIFERIEKATNAK